MATLNIPNSFTNGYVANANEVNANFQSVKTFVESSVLQSDTKTVFLAPVGSITMYTGVTAPAGWLLCDGVTSTASYPALAALVGATTPNLQGRFPIGDNGSLALNGTGGSLTIGANNLPLHAHNNTATWTQGATTAGRSENPHYHTGVTTHEGTHYHTDAREGTTGTAAVSHSHNEEGTAGSIGAGGGDFGTDATDYGGSHSHSFTTSSEVSNIVGITVTMAGTVTMSNGNNTTTASDYYQPYYVVNFIIKHD
jgi:microcystin-dependent protein